MDNPARINRMNNPFIDLPEAERPTSSPWDLRLAFNTLSPAHQKPFMALMQEAHVRRDIYNNPEAAGDTSKLYGLATAAGLDLIATEMVRNWGKNDPDGALRVPGYKRLRSWPAIDNPEPQTLQIWYAQGKSISVMGLFDMEVRPDLRIHHAGHTVMSGDGSVFKPGDWIGSLLMEYARYKVWRSQYEDNLREAPRPATTLQPRKAGIQPS